MDRPGSWLGLARAAGRLALGHWQCRRALAMGRARLVVVARDSSQGARRRWQHLARRANCPVVTWGSQAELGHAVGSGPKAVVAFLDDGLAAQFLKAVGPAARPPGPPGAGRGDEP